MATTAPQVTEDEAYIACLREAWEEAMQDQSPGEPIESLFEELRQKYRAMARAAEKRER